MQLFRGMQTLIKETKQTKGNEKTEIAYLLNKMIN